MQINTLTNPAPAGPRDARRTDVSPRRSVRKRPTLSRRELRRIIAEMIG
jgi:hypothetical protein